MSGMNSGINVNDPTVVAAFKTALLHQGIIALLIFALLGFAWITVRAWLPAAQAGARRDRQPARRRCGRAVLAAVAADRVRPAVGLRRHLAGPAEDGGRASVAGHPACGGEFPALGAAGGELGRDHLVVSPDAGRGGSGVDPGRDRHLDARLAPRPAVPAGRAGQCRLGLVVWVFGESFGGIFAPGLTWLFGAPGAVLIYMVAGGLIALPERAWHARWLGRAILAGTGLFLVGMAVLQAWPGRGFWQGTAHHQPGSLAGMTGDMAQTPQPGSWPPGSTRLPPSMRRMGSRSTCSSWWRSRRSVRRS